MRERRRIGESMQVELSCPSNTDPGVFATAFTSVFAVFLMVDVVGSVGVLWSVMRKGGGGKGGKESG